MSRGTSQEGARRAGHQEGQGILDVAGTATPGQLSFPEKFQLGS